MAGDRQGLAPAAPEGPKRSGGRGRPKFLGSARNGRSPGEETSGGTVAARDQAAQPSPANQSHDEAAYERGVEQPDPGRCDMTTLGRFVQSTGWQTITRTRPRLCLRKGAASGAEAWRELESASNNGRCVRSCRSRCRIARLASSIAKRLGNARFQRAPICARLFADGDGGCVNLVARVQSNAQR